MKNTKLKMSETIKGFHGSLIIIYIATIFAACLRYGLALSYQKTIDSLTSLQLKEILFWVGVGFFFTALWNIGNYIRYTNSVNTASKIVCRLRLHFIDRCMEAPLRETDIISSGEITTKLTDDLYAVSTFYTASIREIIFVVVQLITGLYFTFSVSIYMFIVLIVSSLVCVLSNFLISPHIQKQHALQQKEEDALRTFSEDRLKHPAVTASFNLYESHQKKFTSVIKERTKKILRLEKKCFFIFSLFRTCRIHHNNKYRYFWCNFTL